MLGKLIWENTGDEILFDPVYPDLFEYYVDQLNQLAVNKFSCDLSKFDQSMVDNLKSNLKTVFPITKKIPLEITEWDGDALDQDYLNKLHREWVKTGQKYPALPLLLRQLKLDKDYRQINSNLHIVENSFYYEFVNYHDDPLHINNIFGTDILSFNKANLVIGFDNLGRSSWNKFIAFDDNIHDIDTNDHRMLSGLVELSLARSLERTAPANYVKWCQEKNVEIVGENICLGNIVDLEKNLTSLRKILIRNVHEQSNRFFFEICP